MYETVFLVILFAIIIVLTVIPVIVVYRRARSISGVVPVEYGPPEGINSAEAGYIYYGWDDVGGIEDIRNAISLLPYLASKGYLRISGIYAGQENTEDDLICIVKKYDGNNKSEAMFMEFLERIVTPSGVSGEIGRVSLKELRSRLVQESLIIGNDIRKRFRDLIFARRFKNYALIWIFYCLIFILISFPVVYYSSMKIMPDGASLASVILVGFCFLGALMVPPVVTSFIVNAFITPAKKYLYSGKKSFSSLLIWIIVGLVFVLPLWLLPALFWWWSGLWQNVGYVCLYVFGMVCSIAILYCIDKIRMSKTKYGKQQYEKILGFREYLKKVEKTRIQILAKESPELYYETIAYAYALGVMNDWADEFEIGIVLMDEHDSAK